MIKFVMNQFKNISFKHVFKILLVIWSVFVFGMFAFVMPPQRYGDGHEYIYMSESFIQHNTPAVYDTDIQISQTKMLNQNNIKDIKQLPKARNGFLVSQDGNMYSYHFWLYPLVVSPVQSVLKAFHSNELRAFGITNALFYIAMLWVIFCFAPQKNRYLLLGLMAFSPLIPYIIWPHTEVFSATLVTMALVFYLRDNYKLAILLSGLASCQNPPIAVFSVWVGCKYLYKLYKQYKENKKFDLRDFIITGLCALPILFSPIFYYIKFGTLNLIKHVGCADFSLISFHRFLSYFFDLNQGAILYSGILLFVFIYYIFINLKKKDFKHFELVVSTLLFVLLCMSTTNWFCGMSSVLRYFVWAYPVFVFYVVLNINGPKQNILVTLLLVNMIIICSINSWFTGHADAPAHNLLARRTLSQFPALYNPEHEVFYYRTSKKKFDTRSLTYPVTFSDESGYARKILTDKSGWKKLKDNENYVINDIDFYNSELSKFKDNKVKYINVYGDKIIKRSVLDINNKLMFNEVDKSITGLSIKESWGRWSDGKTVIFSLKFSSLKPKSEFVTLKFDGRPFLNDKRKKQTIKVYANNNYITTWDFEFGKPKPELVISIPTKDIISNSSICDLRFEIDNPKSPKKLGSGNDSRKLGFGFVSIEILNNKTRR